MEVSQIIDAINKVLAYNKMAIVSTLMMQGYSAEMVEEVRTACKIITDAGLYQFDSDCTEAELLMQIEDFIQEGMEENN